MVEKDPEQPLEADINLGPTASRKMGTQSHAHKELNSANTRMSLEADSSTVLPDKGPTQLTP